MQKSEKSYKPKENFLRRLSVNKCHFSENKWFLFRNKRALFTNNQGLLTNKRLIALTPHSNPWEGLYRKGLRASEGWAWPFTHPTLTPHFFLGAYTIRADESNAISEGWGKGEWGAMSTHHPTSRPFYKGVLSVFSEGWGAFLPITSKSAHHLTGWTALCSLLCGRQQGNVKPTAGRRTTVSREGVGDALGNDRC